MKDIGDKQMKSSTKYFYNFPQKLAVNFYLAILFCGIKFDKPGAKSSQFPSFSGL